MEILIEFLNDITWTDIIASCLRILTVLLLAWVAMKLLGMFVNRIERDLLFKSQKEGEPPSEARKRIETITRMIKQGLMLALWITATMVILQELGVEVGPIIASAGIAGVALGFGAQNLVRDIIAGFFIILENQIRVGDVAILNDTGGLVEKINFRTTVLRDLGGVVHIFPNGTIDKLANMTNEWSAYVFELTVAYKENTDAVVELVREVGRSMLAEDHFQTMMLGEPEIFGVDALADSGVVIKGRLKTRPIRQWDVGREFLRRIKLAFDDKGIEIPFPHRTLYFGEASKPFQMAVADKLDLIDARTAEVEKPASSEQTARSPAPQGAHTDKAFSAWEVQEVERNRGAADERDKGTSE